MRLLLASVALAFLVSPTARADLPEAAHRIAIVATVDTTRHRVDGEVTIDFRNTSRAPLESITFHRYLEAFRDERSVFARESRGQLRGVRLEGRGGTELRSIRVDGEERVAAIERELVPGDFTQFRLPLARPLAPGETIRIVVRFVSRLPDLAARAGYVRDFHVVAQWFPKPAKLEDDGSFASFPYHGLGEFYADFADYDVTLDVPADATLEGTGERVESRRRGDRRVDRFVAETVHDAAYVVAPRFETRTRSCEGVTLRVTFPPGYAAAAEEHANATCFGLGYLGRRVMPYPYRTLTVIVPPRGASGGAGMEYPTAFLADGPWYPTRFLPYPAGIDTTMHELAHQWFQGIVATDEVTHPVLDEGLASFVGYDLVRGFTGRPDVARFDAWRPFVTGERMVPPGSRIEAFDESQYGASVYGRSALVLESIARTYGRDRLYRAIARYVRANAFGHPSPEALLESFDAELGDRFGHEVLGPLLYQGRRILFTARREPDDGLTVERTGLAAVPVTIALRTDRGETRVTLRGSSRYRAPRGTRCVVVDPDRRLLLDPRTTDDVACVEPTYRRLADRLRTFAALALRWVGP